MHNSKLAGEVIYFYYTATELTLKQLLNLLKKLLNFQMYCTYRLIFKFYIFIPVFIVFYTYFADALPDEPLGETDCCGFNVLMSIL